MKRLLAILLALVMVFALSACAGNHTATGSEDPTTSKEESKPILPYKGEQVVLDFFWTKTDEDWSDESLPMVEELYKQIGNIRFNVTVLPAEQYRTQSKTMLSSGEVPDLMLLDNLQDNLSYAKNKVFLNLAQYFHIMPNVSALAGKNQGVDFLTSEDGELWGIGLDWHDQDSTQIHFMANTTILNECGVAIPTTAEEFLAALRTVKEKKNDVTPWSPRGNLLSTMEYIAQMYGVRDMGLNYWKEDGKWVYGPTRVGSTLKDTVTFVRTMWQEKLMSHTIDTQTDKQVLDRYYKGKAAFTCDSVVYFSHDSTKKAPFTQTGFESAVFATPNGGNPSCKVIYHSDKVPQWACVTGANTEHPQLIAALLDFMLSKPYGTLYNYGVEGVTFEYNGEGTPQFKQVLSLPVFGYNEGKSMKEYGLAGHPILSSFAPQWKAARRACEEALWIYEGVNAVEAKITDGELAAYYVYPIPKMTQKHTEEYNKIMAAVDSYFNKTIVKFCTGALNMEKDWENFMTKLRSMNIERALEILNRYEVPNFTGLWR